MKKFTKLSLTLLLAFAVTSPALAPANYVPAQASAYFTTATGYDSWDDVTYKTVGSYVVNWGARGEDCVFLSKYAQSFYSGNYSYEVLSQKAGGTSESNAASSALYTALQSLMSSKHTHKTDYAETKDLYKYTDCLLNDYSEISSFYSGKMMTSSWGSGWNREHTWPDSKGNKSQDSTDIMMLRPTSTDENGSRGNSAYGTSTGYYDPNTVSGGTRSVRGDCARIMLYSYVRWNLSSKMWGNGSTGYGVMESADVLLDWMEEDPVDTWEMARNDAVQSITGTRNVFVDYPEYAWKLFGESFPGNMSTPSGIAKGANPNDSLDEDIPSSGGGSASGGTESGGTSSTVGTSAKEILQAAYALGTDQTLNGTHTLKGTVTNIEKTSSGDVCLTFEVKGYENMPIYCYWLQDADFVQVGYTITVTGQIKNYGGLVEYWKPTLDSYSTQPEPDPPAVEPETPTPETPNTPATPVDPDSCEHSYGKWYVEKSPTNNSDGSQIRFCSKCGHKQTEVLPMLTGNGGFFASIWQAIMDFFRSLFGIQ